MYCLYLYIASSWNIEQMSVLVPGFPVNYSLICVSRKMKTWKYWLSDWELDKFNTREICVSYGSLKEAPLVFKFN